MREEAYHRAIRIAKAKKKLRSHSIVTVVLVAFLLVINLMAGGDPWFQWPMLGLGIPLIIHALVVYMKEHLENYEQKTVQKELRKFDKKGELIDDDYLELDEFDEELDLDELPELREEWKDSDFV